MCPDCGRETSDSSPLTQTDVNSASSDCLISSVSCETLSGWTVCGAVVHVSGQLPYFFNSCTIVVSVALASPKTIIVFGS